MVRLVTLTPAQREDVIKHLIGVFLPYVPGQWRSFVLNYIMQNFNPNDITFDISFYQIQKKIEEIVGPLS